jgi:hypothetical protein
MGAFGISIFDGSDYKVVANGATIIIEDHSNYDTSTEVGHTQSDFNFKKIKVINPNNTEYLFSTEGDGDEPLSSPSVSVLPIPTTYNYTTGDGVYTLIMYTVPTWNSGISYTTIGQHHVFLNGKIYKCIANTTGDNPATSPTKWVEVTIDELPSKYRLYHKFSVYCDIICCYLKKVYDALCGIESTFCGQDICKNKKFMDAVKLGILIDNIKVLSGDGDWVNVVQVINLAKKICCCYE